MEQMQVVKEAFESDLKELWSSFNSYDGILSDKTENSPEWVKNSIGQKGIPGSSRPLGSGLDGPSFFIGAAPLYGKLLAAGLGKYKSVPTMSLSEELSFGDTRLYDYQVLKEDNMGSKTILTEGRTLGPYIEQNSKKFGLKSSDDVKSIAVGRSIVFVPTSNKYGTGFVPFVQSKNTYGCRLVFEDIMYHVGVMTRAIPTPILPNNNMFKAERVEDLGELEKSLMSDYHAANMVIISVPVRVWEPPKYDFPFTRTGLGSDRSPTYRGGNLGTKTLGTTKGLELSDVKLKETETRVASSKQISVVPDFSRKPLISQLYVIGARSITNLEKLINDAIESGSYL